MFSIQTGSESLSLEDISDQLEKLRVKIEKVERVPDQVERLRARMEEMANIFDHAMDNIELMQNKTLEMMQTLDYLVEKVDNTNRVVLDLSLNRRLEAEGVQREHVLSCYRPNERRGDEPQLGQQQLQQRAGRGEEEEGPCGDAIRITFTASYSCTSCEIDPRPRLESEYE
uniref:Uncharacterized protein n=1 Tax=Trichogramma kaykai TaxID=54128 RepID=A0ABD2X8B2_9HYME